MDILIKKRNGKYENLCVEKTKKMVALACEGLDGCDPMELEMDSKIQFKNGMSTKEIQQVLIRSAIEKVIVNDESENGGGLNRMNSKWQYVAARLFLFDLYKEAKISRNYKTFGYGDFNELVEMLVERGIYTEDFVSKYSKAQRKELADYIDPDRDFLFNYEGVKLLADRYLVQGMDGEVLELPQERFMAIAMHLASVEEDKVHYAKAFYDLLSKLKMTVATPTLANAGTTFNQLSSCFISTVSDNLWSIYDVNSKFSKVSKHGGALGIYLGKVRSLGSDIRGFSNASGGVIPWVRLYNDTAVAVDQLGRRKGGASITLDIWHKDLYEFIDLRTNNGDDRRKAHDIFPAISIPDIFMERLINRQDFSLFDPHEVEKLMGFSLEDYYDKDEKHKEFSERYKLCENDSRLAKITVPALDIMKKIMKSAVETGTPFIFFRDTVNRANPNSHAGMIYGSNLCHEIAQNMSETKFVSEEIVSENGKSKIVTTVESGDMVTCNLNSINLGNVAFDELKENVPLQIRMLDNVITLNMFPVSDAEVTSLKYRAIGLGVSGYHHYLAKNAIAWENEKHIEEADRLFEEIAYNAIKASMELAREKGAYAEFEGSKWQTGEYFDERGYVSERWQELKKDVMKYGLRNGYLMAVAPTGSTSNIAGTTAGIDPIFKKFFVEEKKGSFTPKTAPELNDETFWYYKEAHYINQLWSIKACAARQRHIDQAQSFNLYITPDVKAKDILDLYVESFKSGIKTIYYVRNRSLEMDECTSCSS
ncbi:ribonucleoside-diphosphate reductase subunit alpha [Catonella massiliensis]|uniref:Ribonucleoside-diphosphate reductase n=1 Tax=Catonella massiliensis TaxID=2799636 RepID=A0ABS1J0P3_9FIRM|nr:ribonucleoside-diphosphate reductase subunit alpha [Catonella massiliensis]MBK5897565.1 ribonucleoside-diphosphate reductase subunit alpha [Catonella massiliensis]